MIYLEVTKIYFQRKPQGREMGWSLGWAYTSQVSVGLLGPGGGDRSMRKIDEEHSPASAHIGNQELHLAAPRALDSTCLFPSYA